jgi:peptide/nickel transport system substrate-binding protein
MNNSARRISPTNALFTRLERGGASDRFLLKGLFFAIVGVAVLLAITLSSSYSAIVPTRGGVLTEGIVGIPRFVNPALAITRADQDMVALVYSGLMRLSEGGTLVPDVAESITLSDDGRTYSVTLRKDVRFHDGTPLTAQDVAYTIELIQNPDLKSPLRGTWNNVSVNVLGEYDLEIALEETYAPFIENFTLGIMPRHIWQELPIEQLPFSQYNTEPIGAGPFEVSNVGRDAGGLISSYELSSFESALNTPNLSRIDLFFYKNETELETALGEGKIKATAYLTTDSLATIDQNRFQIIEEPLPRIFGIFFNQNRSPVVRDRAVRDALSAAIDRNALIDEVLGGYGIPTTGPTLTGALMVKSQEASPATTSDSQIRSAQQLLQRGGWTQNSAGTWEKRLDGNPTPLQVTIRSSNNAPFSAVVADVAERWRALGVEVTVEQFEQADLVQSVIRPRDFETLFFGIDMNRSEDLYPFWHSSQKDDPGLNVAQYTNIAVDNLLEDARVEHDPGARALLLADVATRIENESPAIFLFAPTMTYVVAKDITTTALPKIHRPSDRFVTVASWYATTDTLWSLFSKVTFPEASTETPEPSL